MEISNLKIIFINIYSILFIAGTTSIHQLQLDLIEIETTLNNVNTSVPLVPEIATLILSSFVIFKFCVKYFSLAAHVIALYPILNNELSDLLIPTILLQLLQNIILNLVELSLGYMTCRYYLTKTTIACKFFFAKMILKALFGATILDIYWKLYNQIRYPNIKTISTREFLKRMSQETTIILVSDESTNEAADFFI